MAPLRNLIYFIFLFAFVTTNAFAVEYEYFIEDPAAVDPTGTDPSAGKLEELYAYYNSSTKVFQWRTEFSPVDGKLPDGYWLAVNNGPNPKGHAGELALLYADFTDPNDPILTVYAYNGANGFSSYREGCIGADCAIPGVTTPDRIQSSLVDTGLVLDFTVDDTTVPGNRIINLKIDASVIRDHTPLNPDPEGGPWYGLGFDTEIGYWFHTTSSLPRFLYCDKGSKDEVCTDVAAGQSSVDFLQVFGATPGIGWTRGHYDKHGLEANTVPHCTGLLFAGNTGPALSKSRDPQHQYSLAKAEKIVGSPGCIELEINKPFKAALIGGDGDGDKLTVSYSGVPTGALIDPPSGASQFPPFPVNFSWTPTLTDAGSSHLVDILFDDGLSEVSCPLSFCVPEDQPPVCDLAITGTPECAGPEEATVVRFDASGSFDPEGVELVYEWSTDCVDNEGVPLVVTPLGDGEEAEMVFLDPGLGHDVSCNVSVTVFDRNTQSSNCNIPVEIEACEFECLPSQEDACGVCFGPGENCCADEGLACDPCDQSIVRDACDVCNGPGVDECGTCDGSIVPDQCGVCDGDGTSCLGCESLNITGQQFELDSNAQEQLQYVRQAIRVLKTKGTRPRANRRFAKSIWEQSHSLYESSWFVTWSIPSVVLECENETFCIDVSHVSELATFSANAEELFSNARKTVRRVRRQVKRSTGERARAVGRRALKRARRALDQSVQLVQETPVSTTSCTTG